MKTPLPVRSKPYVSPSVNNAGLSALEFRIFAHLCHRAVIHGNRFRPVWKEIGERTGIHQETVSAAVKRLKAKGLLSDLKKSHPVNPAVLQAPPSLEESRMSPEGFRVMCHVISTEAETGECSTSLREISKVTRITRNRLPAILLPLRLSGFLLSIRPGVCQTRFYEKPLIDSLGEWQEDFVKQGLADGTFSTRAEAIHAFLHTPLTSIKVTDEEVKFQLPEKPKNVVRPDFTTGQQQTA